MTERISEWREILVRFAVILVGILLLLLSPISTGPGLGPSGAFGDFLAVIIGTLLVIVSAHLSATKLFVFLPGHLRAAFAVGNRKHYLIFIMVLSVIGFFMITVFIPVRSEPTGWYYYTDDHGCTSEYQLGTGPDPNPPQQSITGMYYNLWGLPMEHAYPSDYEYQVCG